MAKVVIAFDADPKRVGATEEVDDEQARILVNEGRAQWASGGNEKKSGSRSAQSASSAPKSAPSNEPPAA